ncbi:unnamed protein product [Didymodactylos carnosus]|uniref:Ankyrin repeat protein n=1 Tax=Didymodactylos carnosus TaxID=1234261 RepID=A0A815W424_9BILA|nr:unnamed protein product [Didymodactylos carnosus]CAF4398422.1 unnamed protein product [Didymodactylos carnosus]
MKPVLALFSELDEKSLLQLYKRMNNISVEINRSDKNDVSPLHATAACKALTIAKIRVDYDVNVNVVDNYNLTPLHYACHRATFDIVNTLLQAGSDSFKKDMNGMTPIECEIFRNYFYTA